MYHIKPKKKKEMIQKTTKLFLRAAISIGFLSAVADRLGLWSKDVSAWGNWDSFIEYTQLIIPFVPNSLITPFGFIATAAEVVFAILIIIGFKTELFAKLSGFLLLSFALAMSFSTGLKGVLDYSVFSASAAAFALGAMKDKYMELDLLFLKTK